MLPRTLDVDVDVPHDMVDATKSAKRNSISVPERNEDVQMPVGNATPTRTRTQTQTQTRGSTKAKVQAVVQSVSSLSLPLSFPLCTLSLALC